MSNLIRNTFINFAILLLVTGVTLLALDWGVGWFRRSPKEKAAAELEVDFDRRDRLQVVIDYRLQDPNWYPAVPSNTFLGKYLEVDGIKVLPFTAVPLANTIGCNEVGYFSTYHTDEYGFNNPVGTWSQDSSDGLFFVGDSFTLGSCLNQGSGYVDQLRARFPNVVNIAIGGNGPLIELASIREYLPEDFHGTVFWAYYEGNDLMDLNRDYSDPLLRSYLDPEFSQGLLEIQDKVGKAVTQYVDWRFAEKIQGQSLLLPNIRKLMWQLRQQIVVTKVAEKQQSKRHDIQLFTRVLKLASDEVGAGGGRLVFIYLPEFYRYGVGNLTYWAAQRDEVLLAVESLGIDIIDLNPSFAAHSDPVGLYSLRVKAHYNEAGYRLVADAVSEYLN